MTKMITSEQTQQEQKAICEQYGSAYIAPDIEAKIGLAIESLGNMPITGVRLKPENGTDGWYIWAGDYSDEPDFFKPVHIVHLEDFLPQILKYMALAPGFKFIIDDEGYEDVWFEPESLG